MSYAAAVPAAFAFEVPGLPVGKERARVVNGRAFTPKRTAAYERGVYLLALAARPRSWPLDQRYHVELTIHERVGQGGRRGAAPDVDNVLKACLDPLRGVAFADDRQVDVVHVSRHRHEGPAAPKAGVQIQVRRWPEAR